MHAGAQDLVGFRDVRIGELREGEGGLHRQTACIHPAGLSTPFGSKLSLTRRVNAASAAPAARTPATAARIAAGARISVAWPPVAPHGGARCARRRRRPRPAARPRSARRPSRRRAPPPPERARRSRARASARWRCARARGRRRANGITSRTAFHSSREVASSSTVIAPNDFSSASSACLRCATDGATPSSRSAVDRAVPASAWSRAASARGKMRGAGHIVRPSPARGSSPARRSRRRARHEQRLLRSRRAAAPSRSHRSSRRACPRSRPAACRDRSR